MRERCECCGNLLPIRGLPEDVHLPDVKRKIWEAVYSWPGMSANEIIDWIYGHDPNGGPDDLNVIAVHVAQMNKVLRGYGIEISNFDRTGYRVRTI